MFLTYMQYLTSNGFREDDFHILKQKLSLGGSQRGSPRMTTSTVTARRKEDPQHYVEGKKGVYRRKASESASAKAQSVKQRWLVLESFWVVCVLIVCSSKLCGRLEIGFALVSQPFADIEHPASISASIIVCTSENDTCRISVK